MAMQPWMVFGFFALLISLEIGNMQIIIFRELIGALRRVGTAHH